MEIVGEAATRVSPEVRQKRPQVPWRDIADLRNRLIHGYDRVDHNVLWDVIQFDLPPLVEQLKAILEELDKAAP